MRLPLNLVPRKGSYSSAFFIVDADGKHVANISTSQLDGMSIGEGEEVARRICAAVNTLAPFSTEALEGGVIAEMAGVLKLIVSEFAYLDGLGRDADFCCMEDFGDVAAKARAVLKKLEAKP